MVIYAQRTLGTDSARVYAFLSDLRNHWQLTGRWVRVLGLTGPEAGPTGGEVELRGPLGTRRRAWTTVVGTDPGERIEGIAELASGTTARVSWVLGAQGPEQTSIALTARIVRASRFDGLILRLGGSRWLKRRFEATLDQLALALARERWDQRSELVEEPLGAHVLEDPFAL